MFRVWIVASLMLGGCNGSASSVVDPVSAALPLFRQAVGFAQDPSDPRTGQAAGLIGEGKNDEARALLDAVLRKTPDAGRPRFLLGYTHHKEKRYAQARPYFEDVLDAGPTFERAYVVFYFYGWCQWYLGETESARKAFEATLEFDPEERDAYYALGLIALEEGRLDDAQAHLQQGIALIEKLVAAEPDKKIFRQDMAKAHARLADVELQRGNLAEARKHLEQCVNVYPAAYEAWFKLSRVLTRLGDEAQASRAFAKHLEWKQRLGR